MDIQREKEAFQKFCEESFDFERHEQTYFDEQTQCYENDIGEDTESINMAWSAWQAAKAQADQKIKLLLCDEHLKKCESPTGIFNSQYPDEEPCLICLAKEAKAQAVPDTYTPIVLALEDVQSKIAKTSFLTMDGENENEVMAVDVNELAAYIDELIEAQEPTND